MQIHVASLESVWLSMLHNYSEFILKWHLFILFIPLLRVILTHVHLMELFSMGLRYQFISIPSDTYAHHQGHSLFLLLEMFEVDRRNLARGTCILGVDIILIKHHVNQQWVQTGWLVPSSAELTTIFPSITVLLVFGQKMRTSGAAFFTFLLGA